jgi:hypothetical protein
MSLYVEFLFFSEGMATLALIAASPAFYLIQTTGAGEVIFFLQK